MGIGEITGTLVSELRCVVGIGEITGLADGNVRDFTKGEWIGEIAGVVDFSVRDFTVGGGSEGGVGSDLCEALIPLMLAMYVFILVIRVIND